MKSQKINLFIVNRVFRIYNGLDYVKKKALILDLNNNFGKYVFTRRVYTKSLKFFRFKY